MSEHQEINDVAPSSLKHIIGQQSVLAQALDSGTAPPTPANCSCTNQFIRRFLKARVAATWPVKPKFASGSRTRL